MVPQIIFMSLVFISLLIVANKHGKEQRPYNFWTTLVSTLITLTLLYLGGFFNPLFNN